MNKSPHMDDPIRKLKHDVKGCLNSLVLSVEVLGQELEPEEAADFLEGMQRAADKMARLMEELPYSDEAAS